MTVRTDAVARLLLVDDPPGTAEALTTSLRHAGFEVSTASDGEHALAAVRCDQPDLLLLLNVLTRGVNGVEVLRQLQREHLGVPVILLSAHASTEDTVTGLALGAEDVITQPCPPLELVARIRAVLRRTRRPTQVGNLCLAELALGEGARCNSSSPTTSGMKSSSFSTPPTHSGPSAASWN